MDAKIKRNMKNIKEKFKHKTHEIMRKMLQKLECYLKNSLPTILGA